MGGRVFIELLLFLTPFMVFLVYRAASRDMLIRDRWPLTTLVVIGTVLAAAALIITPLLEPNQRDKCFQAAQYIGGKVIPAKEVDCAKAQLPGATDGAEQQTAPSPPPVAPRDRGAN
jgi:NADH:ubiquinone oxidoreductase subunit 3 (subunit A)